MSIFTDGNRVFLTEMRAITTNAKGQEILVGLTFEETEFYMGIVNRASREGLSDEDSDRYLELRNKHEMSRLSVLAAENQLLNDNPQRH